MPNIRNNVKNDLINKVYVIISKIVYKYINYVLHSPWPLWMLLPWVSRIWLSNSCSSDLSSDILWLLFLTIVCTSDRDFRSVATTRSFSAPSLIYNRIPHINPLVFNKQTCFILINNSLLTLCEFHVESPPWSLRVDWAMRSLGNYLWNHICDSARTAPGA